MATAKLFRCGRLQAVRLPEGFRFQGTEVGIARLNDIVILFPAGKEWEVMERGISQFTNDFMADREQPKRQQRRKR